MIDPIREKIRPVLLVAAVSVLGVGLARGLERWGPARGAGLPPGMIAAGPGVEVPVPRDAAWPSAAFSAIAESMTPAVVRIQAERSAPRRVAGLPFGPREDPDGPRLPGGRRDPAMLAGGSGILVSPDGYILTNNHVIEGADRIQVTLLDKRTFEAEVIGGDRTTDVAVIRIRARDLPFLRLGDSDEARVGEWVLAIGNPGFEHVSTLDFTVTSGIISAKGRPLYIINRELAEQDDAAAALAIEDFIQTDAVINPGNSGGPLVNLRGEVVGINTAIASPTGYYQGYGFAIPSNLARRVMRDLIAHGRVRRALLGITIADVDAEDAEVFGLPEISGVLVVDFPPGSPAQRSGLERGDVIVAVNGRKVDRVGTLQRVVAQHEPGEVVAVEVIRYGAALRFDVRLTQAEIAAPPTPQVSGPVGGPEERLGLRLGDLTEARAGEFGYTRAGGVVVLEVARLSPADRKGVRRGHRVVAIDRQPVESAEAAEAALRALRSGAVVSLLLEAPDGRTSIANLRVP